MNNHQTVFSFMFSALASIWNMLTFCFDVKSLLAESRESIALFLLGVIVVYNVVMAFSHINNNGNKKH